MEVYSSQPSEFGKSCQVFQKQTKFLVLFLFMMVMLYWEETPSDDKSTCVAFCSATFSIFLLQNNQRGYSIPLEEVSTQIRFFSLRKHQVMISKHVLSSAQFSTSLLKEHLTYLSKPHKEILTEMRFPSFIQKKRNFLSFFCLAFNLGCVCH